MKRLVLVVGLSLVLLPVAAVAQSDSFDFNATGGSDSSWSAGSGGLFASSGVLGQSLVVTDANGNNPANFAIQLIANGTNMTTGFLPMCAPDACSFMEGSELEVLTGSLVGFTGSGGIGSVATYSGGELEVTDDIYGDCPSGACFFGTFVGDPTLTVGGGNTLTFNGTFLVGTLDPILIPELAFFGAPINGNDPNLVEGTLTFTLSGGLNSNAVGSCGVDPPPCFHSGDLIVTPVPEPGTLTLLGTGLLSLAGVLRRKLRKQ